MVSSVNNDFKNALSSGVSLPPRTFCCIINKNLYVLFSGFTNFFNSSIKTSIRLFNSGTAANPFFDIFILHPDKNGSPLLSGVV